VQYGTMIGLEYFHRLSPYVIDPSLSVDTYPPSHVFYRIGMTILACFAVAFLSGLLSEQVRKTRIELEAMEDHVKRVEKMAYMGEMAANLAHEIKNPLASLAGAVQMLREDLPRFSDHEKLMQIVLRECDRLSELVNNFLLFARPTLGQPMPICLDRALEETAALFEKSSHCRNRIEVRTDLTPGVWVEMDPSNLKQVLWNLLLNAAEAIDGSGSIRVRLHAERQQRVRILIQDDGAGLSKEVAQSIFDPFFTTKPHGTGLGLSIVHRILESYGMRLSIESEEGRGTTVRVLLKRVEAPQPP
jgi:two-component system sensor histidine kinase PilS (NtrC family)